MGELATRRIGYTRGALEGQITAQQDDPSAALVSKILEWFRNSARANERWRREAVESYQFISNDQWDEATLQAMRDADGNLKRPALVINKILGPILFLAGIQRQSRTEPRLLPFEASDVRPAELMNYLLKYVSNHSREPAIDSNIFLDKIITGLGWWKVRLDFDDDPAGTPVWERAHPLSVFPDPNWLDQGWESCQYVTHAIWMTEEEAIDANPEFEEDIKKQFGEWLTEGTTSSGGIGQGAGDSLSDERLFWDPATQRLRVLECWYKRRLKVTVARNNQTGDVEGDPERVKFLKRAVQQYPEAAAGIQFINRPVTKVRYARVLNNLLLSDDESPFDAPDLPLFPTLGYYWWQRPFGLVEVMKDPQREKNKRRSAIIESVARMPRSGFFNKKDAGAKTEDIENFASGEGAVINYQDQMPTRIDPPELSQTLVFLESRADEEVRDTVNITRELLGNSTQRTVSGRAIEARQRGGLTTQEPMLESFRQDKERAAKFMVEVIQQYVPLAKALRILGTIAVRDQMSPVGDMMQAPDVAEMLKNALLTKFDVVIDASKPFEPTLKMAIFENLKEVAAQWPDFIPPDVLIEAGKDAGLVNDDQAAKILMYAQQVMALRGLGGQGPAGPAPAPPSRPAAPIGQPPP